MSIKDSLYYALVKKLIPEETYENKLNFIPIKRDFSYPLPIILACAVSTVPFPEIATLKTKEKESFLSNEIMLEYMGKMIDSMTDTKKEIRKNVKARYHKLISNSEFPMFESDKITSKEQFLTEYLPQRIACVFCYTFAYKNYDKEAFDYVSSYVEKEYQKIKPEVENFATYSEMIAFLSNHCIEHDIFVVCKKASVQMKVDKERMNVDFQYITILVFNSMYKASKNDYADDIALPLYSEENFQQEARRLLPEGFFLENRKSVRPNTLCKKLKESDSAYVENEIRKAQYITFSKLSEELENLLNFDNQDEKNLKETILNRISILMELVGYQKRAIPKSIQEEFYNVYQLFSKDFLLRIKKYKEQGCIDYQVDKENNEILQIINRDSEVKAIYQLCRMMKVICLIESTSRKEYQKKINNLNINEKHLRAICCYYKALSA
ncbi:MAG: hypothetical protein K2J39_03990 [Ruminococcus sp.]|nr:hypothetical protein [Ruminococcus sp.]